MRLGLLTTGGVMLMLAAVAAADPSPAEIRARAAELLADAGFQTELPGAPEAAPASARGRGRDRAEHRSPARQPPENVREGRQEHQSREIAGEGRPARRRGDWTPPRLLGGEATRAFLWVLLAVVLIVVLGSAMREVRRGRRQRARASDPVPAQPADDRAGAGLDEVEALARSARYAEAVHRLLEITLERLGRHLYLDRSLTSREILRRPDIAPSREPLAILVDTVERSWFGGSAVDRDAYEHCLAAGRRLAGAAAATPGSGG